MEIYANHKKDFTKNITREVSPSFVRDWLSCPIQRKIMAIQCGFFMDLLIHRLEVFFT